MRETQPGGKNLAEPLTRREMEILAHLAHERSNAEIAQLETLTLGSVKWYVNQILGKLGVANRQEAAERAKELGLLKSTQPDPPNNLPRQLSSFIGREREIAQLLELTRIHPLVTVTGAGGSGKTRLALQTAEKAMESFVDGVWLVELAPLADPQQVARAVMNALDLPDTTGLAPARQVEQFLRAKHCLLVLDNCEHVVEAAAELARELLRALPRLHILSTSREILSVEGEAVFYCPTLSLPDTRQHLFLAELRPYEAPRLFVERAQAVSPGFELTEANADQVVRICQRLDGIPLAIELAAARLRFLSFEQISARLEDVFRLLTGGSRTNLPRHQTLKALIDWSYNLLGEKERLLLMRLSVFAGGWTIEGAESVCAGSGLEQTEILDRLGQLVDKSLIYLDSETSSGQPRFGMLETIRQYSRERLFESGAEAVLRERHLDYYLDLARRADINLRGREARLWLEWMDEEFDNLRRALEWASTEALVKGLNLISTLTWYFISRSFPEGEAWARRLLAVEARGEPILRGRIERRASRGRALVALALINGYCPDLQALAREATEIFTSLGSEYELDWALALSRWNDQDLRPLEVFRRVGDHFSIGTVLWPLIMRAIQRGELQQAYAYTSESLENTRQAGYLRGETILITMKGIFELMEGRDNSVLQCLDEIWRQGQVSDTDLACLYLLQLARFLSLGSYDEALAVVERWDTDARLRNDKNVIWSNYGLRARIALSRGDVRAAEEILREADNLAGIVDYSLQDLWLLDLRSAHAQLAIARGDHAQAAVALIQLLDHWFEPNQTTPVQGLFISFGRLAARMGQHRRAAVCFGAQDEISRQVLNLYTPRERMDFEQALAETQAALGKEEFAAAFAEGKRLSLEQALEYVSKI